MTKKILAIDLDGTLLDAQGHYSTQTRDHLRKLSEKGYLIVLASGRPYRAMKAIYEDLRIDAPIICYNGALAFHPRDRFFQPFEVRFPRYAIRRIFARTKSYVLSYMCESDDTAYVYPERNPYLSRYFPYQDMEVRVGDYQDIVEEDVFTCLFNTDPSDRESLREECEKEEGIRFRPWSNSTYSELYVEGIHKGTALSFIMKQLQVDKENVYAFGDAGNDLEMLKAAGHPYVMRGSKALDLLQGFPLTKYPVEEDGVMKTLEEILP